MGSQLSVFLFVLLGYVAVDVCALRVGLHEDARPTLDDRGPAIIANAAINGADTLLRLEIGRSNVLLSGASHGQDIVISLSGVDIPLQPKLTHRTNNGDSNFEALGIAPSSGLYGPTGYISLFFDRSGERASSIEGTLAIGEVVPQLNAVLAMPHIPVLLSPSNGQDGGQDVFTIAAETSVFAPTMDDAIHLEGSISVSLASPYSLVPARVAHAIYSNLESAELVNGLWRLPCDTRIGASVIIGGETYPIHPWDTVLLKSSADGLCVGSFRPLRDGKEGITLGWAFLRNTYMLVHAGDKITHERPYIQLLSVSDETEGRVIIKSDLSNVATHPTIVHELRRDDDDSNEDDHPDESSGDDSEQHDGDSEQHDDDDDNTPVLIGIAVAAGVMVIVAIALIIWIRRRKFWREHQRYRKRASNVTSYAELGMHADGHHSVMSLRPNAPAAHDAHSGMGVGVGHGRNISSDSITTEHPSRPPSANSMNNFHTFGHQHNKSSLSIVEYPPAAYSRMPASRSPSPDMVGTHTRGSSSQDVGVIGHRSY